MSDDLPPHVRAARRAGRPGGTDAIRGRARRRRPSSRCDQARSAAPSTKPRVKSSSGRWLNLLLGVAVAVAIGGVAFAVGRSTAPASAAAFPGAGTFPATARFPGNGSFPGPARPPAAPRVGERRRRVASASVAAGSRSAAPSSRSPADTMTITTANGQTVEVTLDGEHRVPRAGRRARPRT